MKLKEYAKLINKLVENGHADKTVLYSDGKGCFCPIHYHPNVADIYDDDGNQVVVIN